MMIRLGPSLIAASLTLVSAVFVPAATGQPVQSAPCDGECLSRVMADFLKAMTSGGTGSVPLAANAEIRENAKLVPIAGTVWKNEIGRAHV